MLSRGPGQGQELASTPVGRSAAAGRLRKARGRVVGSQGGVSAQGGQGGGAVGPLGPWLVAGRLELTLPARLIACPASRKKPWQQWLTGPRAPHDPSSESPWEER